jgi:hypothetical protein
MRLPPIPRRLHRPLGRLVREARSGLANSGTVPLKRQLQLWRHGFYSQNAHFYDFDTYGFGAYVSDFQRATGLERINDPIQRALLNDKLVAFLYLRAVGAPTPTVYGYSNGDQLVCFDDAPAQDIEGLLKATGRLVVKPRGGSGGSRFALLEQAGDTTLVNRRPNADLGEHLRGRVVVSEFIEQHAYAREIHPHTTNTMRLLVLRDSDTGEPFVTAATHRFGTQRSFPVDNIARGGMSADVDVETGILGPLAAVAPTPGPIRWHDAHPETGAPVRGTSVPRWSEIVDEVQRVTTTLEGLHCVGWDVAVTQDGFQIIEGNNRPDTAMQLHGPFLTDERTRRVFEAHGVVPRSPHR